MTKEQQITLRSRVLYSKPFRNFFLSSPAEAASVLGIELSDTELAEFVQYKVAIETDLISREQALDAKGIEILHAPGFGD